MMGYPYPLIQANERRAMTTEEKIKLVLNNANDFDIETIKLMAKGIVPLKIDNPQKVQEVWVCKDCRNMEKTSKKGQVSSKNPTLNIETSENIKIDESMNYLIPQMESEYISRKIRGKNDLNVLQEAFEFNVANYNNKNTEF